MTNKTDLIIILAVLGVAVFILWKSGIFKLANTASDLATDIVKLPENIGTLVSNIPDVIKSAGTQIENATGWDLPIPSFNDDIAKPTDRAINIVNSLKALYPNMTTQQALKANARDGIKYDQYGFPINPQDARQVIPY